MIRKIVFIAIFFLTGCVENLVNISVLHDGSYLVKYTSIGSKADLIDADFKHPESDKNVARSCICKRHDFRCNLVVSGSPKVIPRT